MNVHKKQPKPAPIWKTIKQAKSRTTTTILQSKLIGGWEGSSRTSVVHVQFIIKYIYIYFRCVIFFFFKINRGKQF